GSSPSSGAGPDAIGGKACGDGSVLAERGAHVASCGAHARKALVGDAARVAIERQLRAVFVLAPRRDGERAVEGGDGRFKALGLALLRACACERPAEAQEAGARVRFADVARIARGERKLQGVLRSEEHTSELQS